MKLLVLGASGRVGHKIVKRALADHHDVVALVRSPENFNLIDEYLTVLKGNVLEENDLLRALDGVDAIISALNTDQNNTLSRSMPIIVQTMESQQIKRLISIGTAGILDSRTEPNLYRFQSNESKRRKTIAAEDHLKAYQYLEKSQLDWTVVCPTYLPDGESEGDFRVEENLLPVDGKRITVGDTAAFAYSLLNSNNFNKARVGIAY
ncbi:hypothetical protein CFK37_04265 [Virgibacillus phasianinus]|uniref:NAD(P)-binding domain-containing protein n=1 Tax=Virgibacillus phasianinus TaxID=2017483 RepID=A0A220U0I6_9BACI|nr:NAD(P)H-binding protein [Virgibacillus phasianinus]ASK61443.1 hypothetical protein CFK37_04265 [Virgibacillus phasianinus]